MMIFKLKSDLFIYRILDLDRKNVMMIFKFKSDPFIYRF